MANPVMRSWITVLQSLEDKYSRVLKDAVSSMDTGQNLVVVKTVAGMAMAVAAALDALKWPEILGCIAGDDTMTTAAWQDICSRQ